MLVVTLGGRPHGLPCLSSEDSNCADFIGLLQRLTELSYWLILEQPLAEGVCSIGVCGTVQVHGNHPRYVSIWDLSKLTPVY